MKSFTYTLVSDGSSDRLLTNIINWTIKENSKTPFTPQYPEYPHTSFLGNNLRDRIINTLNIYPCDVLFVHRDAEAQPYEYRIQEISSACNGVTTPYIPVIPIRMTEAWLLLSEDAIKEAAGNRKYRGSLNIPRNPESTTDPKELLFSALKASSNLNGRRLNQFNPEKVRHRVAELIGDFSELRKLSAFQSFEKNLTNTFKTLGI